MRTAAVALIVLSVLAACVGDRVVNPETGKAETGHYLLPTPGHGNPQLWATADDGSVVTGSLLSQIVQAALGTAKDSPVGTAITTALALWTLGRKDGRANLGSAVSNLNPFDEGYIDLNRAGANLIHAVIPPRAPVAPAPPSGPPAAAAPVAA